MWPNVSFSAVAVAAAQPRAAIPPSAERALCEASAFIKPAIREFALYWVRNHADNHGALMDKCRNHYACGWTLLGERSIQDISAEELDTLATRHCAAFQLFKCATELQLDLIPALDGLLRLTAILRNKSIITLEVEPIMTSQPNRGNLMRTMASLGPQWNGRPA